MLKVELAIVVLSLSLMSCGTKSRNQPTSEASADEVDNIQVLNPIDPKDVPKFESSTGKGCDTVDQRLTVGTTITKEKRYTSDQGSDFYQDNFTVTEFKGTSITLADVVLFNNRSLSTELTCAVDSTLSPKLKCGPSPGKQTVLDEIPMKAQCQVTHQMTVPPLYENILYGLTKSEKPTLRATKITSVFQGDLTCDGKATGKGTETEVRIYTSEIPSMSKVGCSQALVSHSWKIKDSGNATRTSQHHKITAFKGKSENI